MAKILVLGAPCPALPCCCTALLPPRFYECFLLLFPCFLLLSPFLSPHFLSAFCVCLVFFAAFSFSPVFECFLLLLPRFFLYCFRLPLPCFSECFLCFYLVFYCFLCPFPCFSEHFLLLLPNFLLLSPSPPFF